MVEYELRYSEMETRGIRQIEEHLPSFLNLTLFSLSFFPLLLPPSRKIGLLHCIPTQSYFIFRDNDNFALNVIAILFRFKKFKCQKSLFGRHSYVFVYCFGL